MYIIVQAASLTTFLLCITGNNFIVYDWLHFQCVHTADTGQREPLPHEQHRPQGSQGKPP